jgi:hypothetical protein
MQELKVLKTDGGHKLSGIKDRSNCTVRTLANVAGIEFELADEIATKAGRKRNQGAWPKEIIAVAKKHYGLNFRKLKFNRYTVNKFIRKYPKGRYWVSRRGHSFAIIDGVVYDTNENKPLQILYEAYEFIARKEPV